MTRSVPPFPPVQPPFSLDARSLNSTTHDATHTDEFDIQDAVKKMAVFKLQTNIGDPSFAEVFIQSGGLGKLRHIALNSSGNTLAYALTSFSRLLELDKGWDYVTPDLITRVSWGYVGGEL